MRILLTAGVLLVSLGLVWLLVQWRPAGGRALQGNEGKDYASVPPVRPQDVANLVALNGDLARLVERVQPGVVRLWGKRQRLERAEVRLPDGRKGEREQAMEDDVVGTGVIYRGDGLVVTNFHVVQDLSPLHVTLYNGEVEREGSVVAQNEAMDLAVVRIKPLREAETFPALTLGDSDLARSGHLVLAIGNPFNLSDTITHGVIGHRDRRLSDNSLTNYLQTSCVINPGNSGGPLVSMNGEVIGLITRKVFGPDERNAGEGYGLAIPSNDVRDELDRLLGDNRPRPYLGVHVENWPLREVENPQAAMVTGVDTRSPALEAGLKKGDVITAVNGRQVTSAAEFMRQRRMMEVGHAAQLSVRRDQEELTLKITAQDFNVALPSQGGPHVMVRGLTVRTLSPAEWSGLRITDRTGLRVEEIAPDSPLREVLEKGTVILNAGEKDGELEAVDTPETLDALLTRYATQGGWLTVAGRNGDTEWKEFPPLMR